MITITLPWPPTVNHMYLPTKIGGRALSRMARNFRAQVAVICHNAGYCGAFGAEDKLSVTMTFFSPNRRKRDLDNLAKAVQDALQKVGVFPDDSQIDRLELVRGDDIVPGGSVVVSIEKIAWAKWSE